MMGMINKSGWMVAALLALVPAGARAQAAPRDSGLIVATVDQAVRQPASRIENFALTVDLSDRALYVMSGERVVRRFPVSVGEDGWPTPAGSFRIRHMIWNPGWTPPASSWARGKTREEPGSPGNPMGRVKMFFQEPDYYIHGTGAISSLGNARSHGCIRMRNADAVELARLVMINGGDARNPEWFQQTIGDATTSRDVQLPRPVQVRIRA
jgi:lipoprotein-anchoring transpeptidase ErfK/SrfK